MKEVTALLCANKEFKFIAVKFETNNTSSGWSKPYTFKTLLDVKIEDKVVVPVTRDGELKFKIASVIEVLLPYQIDFDGVTHAWVASILDFSVYEECIEAEKKMVLQLNMAKAKQLQDESVKLLEESVGSKVMGALKDIVKKL